MLSLLTSDPGRHILIVVLRFFVVLLFIAGGRLESRRGDRQMASLYYMMAAVWLGVFAEPYL